MRSATSNAPRLERWLAGLLYYGTWLATGTIGTGLVMALPGPWAHHFFFNMSRAGTHVMTVGIGLFILLPVMRLIVMLGVFLHQRDYRFSAIAALVLAIVIAGSMIGVLGRSMA